MVCRRLRQLRDDGCNAELGELRGSSLRRFTKRRNCSTLQTPLSGNLTFNFKGATRRSAPFHFTSPCSLRGVFAVRPLPAALPWWSLGRHLGTFFFCRQLGTLLVPALLECLGNRDPVFGRIVGRIFRMGWVAESATRNIALKRDAVSLMRLKRKAHPVSELQNGMRFPRGRIVAAALSSVARYSPSTSAASSAWLSTT